MYTAKGRVKQGVILLEEPVTTREGEAVLVTFVSDANPGAEPTVEDVVAKIAAMGPNPHTYTPPTSSLAELLADAPNEEPIDADQWDRQWSVIEAEIKARDLADDRAEGRP